MMTVLMLAEHDPSDSALVALAKSGDRGAFARLVERHYDTIYRAAYRWVGRKADAEDIAQDVCARLGRAIASFRGEGGFATWLYALTMNAARDHGRKAARDSAKLAAFGREPEREREDEGEQRVEALWRAVRQLPDKQREAVTLVHGEGLSHADAADRMGCAEATVSWHIHEARKRLKALVARAEDL